MSRLKPQEQQVLLLAYQEGLPQRNIADQLGVSQMSISRIQRRAIEKLKHAAERERSRYVEGLNFLVRHKHAAIGINRLQGVLIC